MPVVPFFNGRQYTWSTLKMWMRRSREAEAKSLKPDSGREYSRLSTSASWASILYSWSMNCMSWILTIRKERRKKNRQTERSPINYCFLANHSAQVIMDFRCTTMAKIREWASLPNVTGPVTRSQVFAIRTNPDATDSITSVISWICFVCRSACRQILVLQKGQLWIHVQGLE